MNRFSTDNLNAERLNESHLADLVALHLDPEASRYLGGVRSAEATEKYLVANMAHWDQYGFGLWTLRTKDGAFAGRAGIRHILVNDVDEIEIAYAFVRGVWGRGFASEIATALTRSGCHSSSCRLSSALSMSQTAHRAVCWRNRITWSSGARSVTARTW
ncbi:RimJ/RimL family protein N-acetyltransferase [Bradyrhizobium sp. CIR48]|nr:RimJ/RimL family protein N-acetyltransferase [Bradyrhizobium sp. CIR48]